MSEDEIDALALAVANELREIEGRTRVPTRAPTTPPPRMEVSLDPRAVEVPRQAIAELGSLPAS